MLLVKTKTGPSKINGTGLFADQFIPRGTVVWRFTPGFDVKISEKKAGKLPLHARRYFDKYTFSSKEKGKIVLCTDDAKYFNHSKTPNTLSVHLDREEEVLTTAAKNIKRGEELTSDYSTFEIFFTEKWG